MAVRGQLPIQCAIAVGAASVNLDRGELSSFHDGRPYYPVQIDLTRLDGPQCSLSVQKTGTGKGTVYSLPRPGWSRIWRLSMSDPQAPSVGPLNAVWAGSGDVWAVGKTHSLIRRQGATWSDWSSLTPLGVGVPSAQALC